MMRGGLIVLAALCVGVPLAGAGAQDTRLEEVARDISARLPGVSASDVAASPVPGMFEVALESRLFYVSANGRYVFAGRLFDLDTQQDLTEPALAKVRLRAVNAVPEARMIIFETPGATRHTITTFTDVDCPYCRQMHREIAELTAMGIRVRYLLYPRAEVGSASYQKSVSVWCAENRNEALTRVKAGQDVPRRDCANPVREHMALALDLGLSGTPMTITDQGEKITGYVPASALLEKLEGAKRTSP